MSTSFQMWNIRLTEAADEISRRKLIGELGVWRAAHLADIPAMRSAAFLMSRLYQLVGDHQSAVNEAGSLYSLCQTAPVATGEEFKKARAQLQSLGLVVAERGGLVERKKAPSRDPAEELRRLIAKGDSAGAMKLLKGRKGPKASLYRLWIELNRALKMENEGDALADVRRVHGLLGRRLDLGGEARSKATSKTENNAYSEKRSDAEQDPLARFMGLKSLPRKRDPKTRLIERFINEHPERLDDLVSVALTSHVELEGLKRTAPWLAGLVARALVSAPQGETRRCVDRLLSQGAYAVTAYEEAGAKRGIALLGQALKEGWAFRSFRRGVLRDGRLEGRKVWTLKLAQDSREKMVALIADDVDGLESELQGQVLDSLYRISSGALLSLTREQPNFQGLAVEKGFSCVVSEDPSVVLKALAALASAGQGPARPPKASPLFDALRTAEPPTAEVLLPLIEKYRRTYKSFEACRGLLTDPSISDAQERVATFLRAADQVAPEKVKLNEGVTVVVQGAAMLEGGPIARLLEEESALRRYGGAEVLELVPIARAVIEAGWSVRRVMLGPTRRERDIHSDLGEASDALWRLIIEGQEQTAEVWFTKASGGAGVKLLALLPAERPCLILSTEEFSSEASANPATLVWDGSQGAALVEALSSWSKNQEQKPESTR